MLTIRLPLPFLHSFPPHTHPSLVTLITLTLPSSPPTLPFLSPFPQPLTFTHPSTHPYPRPLPSTPSLPPSLPPHTHPLPSTPSFPLSAPRDFLRDPPVPPRDGDIPRHRGNVIHANLMCTMLCPAVLVSSLIQYFLVLLFRYIQCYNTLFYLPLMYLDLLYSLLFYSILLILILFRFI